MNALRGEILGAKFGGTTHARPQDWESQRQIVQSMQGQGKVLYVVHSAVSREDKATGTTSNILDAFDAAELGRTKDMERAVERLVVTHHDAINDAVTHSPTRQALRKQIEERMKRLQTFLDVQKAMGRQRIDRTIKDRGVGIGEGMAVDIAVESYRQAGIDAVPVDLTNVTIPELSDPQEQLDALSRLFGGRIWKVLQAGKLPVVTGHGSSLYARLDRGYSDGMLTITRNNAARRQGKPGEMAIIKRGVPGVLPADPKLVTMPGDRKEHPLAQISFREMRGSRTGVVQPDLVPHIPDGMVLRVIDLEKSDRAGTVVSSDESKLEGRTFKVINVLGLAKEKPLHMITVSSKWMVEGSGFVKAIIDSMEGVTMETVSTTGETMRMTISCNEIKLEELAQKIRRIRNIDAVTTRKDIAQVIIVGRELESTPLWQLTRIVEEVINSNGSGSGSPDRVKAPIFVENDPDKPYYCSFGVEKNVAQKVAQALYDFMERLKTPPWFQPQAA